MTAVPSVTLNNGVEIPQLGFGVFQVPPESTVETLSAAFEIGYRHIDTAQGYRNEREVGQAVAESGIDRSEFFVTSKLASSALDYDQALEGIDVTLAALNLDVLDLFLIHWPLPTVRDYVEPWKAFEKILADGRVRAVGVSNFQVAHLQRIFDECDIVPAVNQIEAHPYLTQAELVAFDEAHGIATEAWSPIARGAVLNDEALVRIGELHEKSAAQVTLRWHIQRGSIIFPKSMSPARMRENFEIFDFELSDVEIHQIDGLDRGQRFGPDPDTFEGPRG
ncbi:MAG TPA: aldo/keto reductase [Acidimicrobiales bacterium]